METPLAQTASLRRWSPDADPAALLTFLRNHMVSSMYLLDAIETVTAGTEVFFELDERDTSISAVAVLKPIPEHPKNARILHVQAPSRDPQRQQDFLQKVWSTLGPPQQGAVGAEKPCGAPLLGVVGPSQQIGVMLGENLDLLPPIVADQNEEILTLQFCHHHAAGNCVGPLPAVHSSGLEVRLATPDDLEMDIMGTMEQVYQKEENGQDLSPEDAVAGLRARLGRLFIGFETTSCGSSPRFPVAMVSSHCKVGSAVMVNDVFVLPSHRRRGYGKEVVAGAIARLQEEAASTSPPLEKAVLTAGDRNLVAQKTYESLGFRKTGEALRCVIFKV